MNNTAVFTYLLELAFSVLTVGVAVFVCYVLPHPHFTRSEAIYNSSIHSLVFLPLAYEWFVAHLLVGFLVGSIAPVLPVISAACAAGIGVFVSLVRNEFDDQLVNMGMPTWIWASIAVLLASLGGFLGKFVF